MPSTTRQLYPDWDEQTPLESYLPIIHYLGTVQYVECSEDLQGVAFVAYKSNASVGVLWFRYGCCVGCDKLADCKTYAEVDRLIKQMAAAIEWFQPKLLPLWHMQMRQQLIADFDRAVLKAFVNHFD